MNKIYTYYYRLRPPAPGCQPKNGLMKIDSKEVEKNGRMYWGVAIYDRELTKNELFEYDLDYITELE